MQPTAEILVFWVILAPFCPTIVVGIASFVAQRLPLALSAEWGPTDRSSEKLEIGTSGSDSKCALVIPLFDMWVWPTSTTSTPSPRRIASRSGKASPPWETR